MWCVLHHSPVTSIHTQHQQGGTDIQQGLEQHSNHRRIVKVHPDPLARAYECDGRAYVPHDIVCPQTQDNDIQDQSAHAKHLHGTYAQSTSIAPFGHGELVSVATAGEQTASHLEAHHDRQEHAAHN